MSNYRPFSYSMAPLGAADTGFRMLELLPSTTATDELACRILVSDIGQPSQDFKALSYTWGCDIKSHSLAVLPATGSSGAPAALAITESLHTALVHLQHAREPLWLWIDQICIDQENLTEKEHQVHLMGRIYTKAEQVLVWLGPAADDSDSLMDAWQSVGQAARNFGMESYHTRERLPLLKRIANNVDPLDLETVKFQTLLRAAAAKFAPLITRRVPGHWFARPWFERAWIVQEFCLCSNTIFVCGTKTVQAELVMLAVHVVMDSFVRLHETVYNPDNVPFHLQDEVSYNPSNRLFSCRQRRRNFDCHKYNATGDQLHALLRKLYVNGSAQASLHRDRIFSLLDLAVDRASLDIIPDYTDSTDASEARILTDAAHAMITNPSTGRIDILCYSQFPKHPSLAAHLPSWVPDWRGNLAPSFYEVQEAAVAHFFSACGPDVAPRPLYDPLPSILALGGYHVDTITDLGEPWDGISGGKSVDMTSWDPSRFAPFLAQIDALFHLSQSAHPALPALYPTARRRAEARWRVPTGDMYWTMADGNSRAPPENEARHAQAAEAAHFRASCEGLPPAERQARLAEWDWAGKWAREETGGDYLESMRYMAGKKPFLTRDGYLGMGPREAKRGDVVVVFCGGRIPFVLRPRGEEEEGVFEFVGEAYCDGVMDGEVVGVRKETKFRLV